MKKLLLGCIAVGAALIALSGCDQDKAQRISYGLYEQAK